MAGEGMPVLLHRLFCNLREDTMQKNGCTPSVNGDICIMMK